MVFILIFEIIANNIAFLLNYAYSLFLGLVFMHDPISCIAFIIIVLK